MTPPHRDSVAAILPPTVKSPGLYAPDSAKDCPPVFCTGRLTFVDRITWVPITGKTRRGEPIAPGTGILKWRGKEMPCVKKIKK